MVPSLGTGPISSSQKGTVWRWFLSGGSFSNTCDSIWVRCIGTFFCCCFSAVDFQNPLQCHRYNDPLQKASLNFCANFFEVVWRFGDFVFLGIVGMLFVSDEPLYMVPHPPTRPTNRVLWIQEGPCKKLMGRNKPSPFVTMACKGKLAVRF